MFDIFFAEIVSIETLRLHSKTLDTKLCDETSDETDMISTLFSFESWGDVFSLLVEEFVDYIWRRVDFQVPINRII